MSLKRISPEEAQDLMEAGYAYVDVRSIPEFEGGHPDGAFNVPWKHMGASGMEANGDFLDVIKAAFALDAKIVVGCKAGGRSKAAAEAMLAAGFTGVVDQRAGFVGARDDFGQMKEAGWQTQGFPVSIEPEAGHTYSELAAKAGK